MKITIYVEGGGDRKDLRARCREGFTKFFEKAGFAGRMPGIVACGSRMDAFRRFSAGIANAEEDAFIVLLVDSEAPVKTEHQERPWLHVREREGDHWEKPPSAEEENLHFMVQCMEAWFFADKAALGAYFGKDFQVSALGNVQNVETIPKADLFEKLKRATLRTKKGAYGKGKDSFELLGRIAPEKVRGASRFAARLIATLDQKSSE